MDKSLNNLPPFTFNSIVKYVRNSGKSIQQAPDYMVVKPFERGANFFIEGYIHNVLAKFHSASKTFYFRVKNFKTSLQDINKAYGLSLYLNVYEKEVPTRMGPAPLGGYLSYQLAPTEGNFEVYCNVDLSNNCTDNNLSVYVYPPFPLSLHCLDFTITQCSKEHQPLLDSLQVNEAEAVVIERETILQHNSSRWWDERKHRITASRFGDVLRCKSVSSKFLKELVYKEERQINSSNLPAPLRHGIENESRALERYESYLKNHCYPFKTFPSGFVVNPAYPFLGCSPDAKVLDEASKDCPFGIIEIQCPYKHRDVTPLTACNGDKDFHLEIKNGFPVLKTSHRYYYQVQGQLGITGSKWCDFITYTFKGMVIERIIFDVDTFISMLLRLEKFFFVHAAKYVQQQNSITQDRTSDMAVRSE